jgi:hypothetical protein
MFLYNKIQWTTGTSSGGDADTGLGGTPAQVCYFSSPPALSGVRVTLSLVLCVCFIDRCTFSFDHCIVCSSIYEF